MYTLSPNHISIADDEGPWRWLRWDSEGLSEERFGIDGGSLRWICYLVFP